MLCIRACSIVSAGMVAVAGSACGIAQDYPTKPIRIVVPFPPGGGTDIVTRTLTQKLGETLGASFVIDNRSGAGGTIGTDIVARSAPDGYTLGMVSGSHTINPSLYKRLPYDALKDFSPISLIVSGPGILVVHPSLAAANVGELIALAKSRQLNYASAGNGTPPHLAAELFKLMAGVDMIHVPYKGNTQAFADLISGQVLMSFPTIPSAIPHVRSGRLRALAVTSAQRSHSAPDVPTIAESGLPGYEANSWYGLLAPARTPRAIVAKLQQEVARSLQLPDVREKMVNQGLDPVGNTPAEFAAVIKAEIPKWAKVVAASGAKAD